MTMNEIIELLMQHADEYAVESYEDIPVGTKQVRTNRRKRINKKWLKRYGTKVVYKRTKCKKIDVTLQTIIDFCYNNNLALPDELRNTGLDTPEGEC